MSFSCGETALESGESARYSKAYTYFKGSKQVGRTVLTRKVAGKWKGWLLLSNVVIYEEFRGKRLCAKMLECVLAKHAADVSVYLEVKKSNVAAVKCYLASGFTITEDRSLLIMTRAGV